MEKHDVVSETAHKILTEKKFTKCYILYFTIKNRSYDYKKAGKDTIKC